MALKDDFVTGDTYTAGIANAVGAYDNAVGYAVTDPAYGAVGDDSNDDTSAIAACVSAAAAAGVPVIIPPGTYKVTAALDWKIPGLVVRGAGKGFCTIKQYTANTPLIQVAGANQDIGHLTLAYASQATSGNTASIAIEFGDDTIGSCFDSTFHDLVLDKANTGMAINPAISVKAGMFSCTVTNVRIRDYSYSAINLVGSNGNGANCTGCVFTNIYTHRTSDAYTAAYYPVFLEYWDEVTFNQLNIEHVTVATYDVMALIYVGSVVFNALHFEVLAHSANGKALIYTHDSKVVINGATCRFNTFSGSGSNPAFRFYGTPSNANVIVSGWNDSSNTVTTPSRALLDYGSGATAVTAVLNGVDLAQFTARTVNGDATSRAWINGAQPPRVATATSSATPTINTDLYDVYGLTAQTADITSFTTNLSGSPVNGQKLHIYVVGTAARAITWGTSFEAGVVALPTTTVTTQRLDVQFVWNAVSSKWRCMVAGSAA